MGIDLDSYLARIGGPAPGPADLPTLRAIVAGHARTIPFEKLDPFTGREVHLADDALVAKLVHGGRGGYCFEHDLLLRGALDALGYRTTGLAARVMCMWGGDPTTRRSPPGATCCCASTSRRDPTWSTSGSAGRP